TQDSRSQRDELSSALKNFNDSIVRAVGESAGGSKQDLATLGESLRGQENWNKLGSGLLFAILGYGVEAEVVGHLNRLRRSIIASRIANSRPDPRFFTQDSWRSFEREQRHGFQPWLTHKSSADSTRTSLLLI